VRNLEMFFRPESVIGRCGELKRRFNGREMEPVLDKKAPANMTISYSELLYLMQNFFVEHFVFFLI
jgi:hypothetical protein